jgi:Flp pilus assembly protein TadD
VIWEIEGQWHRSNGNLPAAEKCFRQAFVLDPRRPSVLKRLAEVELRRGNRAAAEDLIRQARKIFPKNPRYSMEVLLQEHER